MATFTAIRNRKQTAGAMLGVLSYVVQAKKTMLDGVCLVAGSNGVPQASYLGMMTAKQRFQKTVKPPEGLTPKQREKWLNEQAVLFERECRDAPLTADKTITLEKYVKIWLRDVAPNKLAKSTLARDRQDINRFLPYLGEYKLTEFRPKNFRDLYSELRKQINQNTGKPLSEYTVEGVHACLCGILSDAMEGGFINHNPAWQTYKYSGKKKEKVIADEETMQKIIASLENERLKYETYYKLIIATGMRHGECCGLKWSDINYG